MASNAHRAARAALLGLMVIAGGAPLALAGGHMTTYHTTSEHDDLGRSNEPDGASTSVLGPLLGSCNVDQLLDGQCEDVVPQANPHSGARVLAPGCTGDQGRQPSGLCWLHGRTGLVGEPGLGGDRAPGAFQHTKNDQVRFFDLIAYTFPARAFVDHNNKLRDAGVSAILRGVDPHFGSDAVVPGAAGWSAWYGTWQDKNGNGVIDYVSASASNEFVWRGQCGTTPAAECTPEPTSAPVWFFPGNHHAFVTPDLPAWQVACFATAAAQQGVCSPSIETIDDADEAFQGDPLLGPQYGVKPDSALDDRTDDPVNARHYTMGNGFPLWHYDQSLVVGEVIVAAVNPAAGALGGFDPGKARFRDVDVYRTWSPVLEDLLQNQLKGAARREWVSVRDGYVPINKWVDGQVNGQVTDTSAVTGPVDDSLIDPGRSREPNHAQDQYPGASRGECPEPGRTHQGFCNSYAGYQARPHAFADAQLWRAGYLIKPTILGTSVGAIYGPVTIDGGSMGVPARAPGDHRRVLNPGIYDPLGNIGIWHDRAHRITETVFDPVATAAAGALRTSTTTYVVGADGWVGNIVNTTQQFRYRGYLPEPCTISGVAAMYEHAQCDPYSSGAADDPQSYGASAGEFSGWCNVVPTFTLRPDNTWNAPTIVWRNVEQTELVTPVLEDFTGTSRPITLKLECIGGTAGTSGNFVGRDALVLPFGNVATGITTILDTTPLVVGEGRALEQVVDVDYYAPS